jgi:prolyl-tRNA editing enzyme YbaK/EbsC (Cys-tRNA(Pro) deacylase)
MNARAKQIQAYLCRNGLVPQNFDRPTPSSASAAAALGCSVAEIAKSILLMVGTQPVVVITSGDTKIKSSRLKKAAGLTGKVTFPGAAEVERYTGSPPGGVSPFLLPEGLPVFLDQSLQRYELVYPAAATDSSAVAVTFSKLEELSEGKIVNVCDIQEMTDIH